MLSVACITAMVSPVHAKNLWAYLTFTTFNSPEGPYVETYMSVAGNSVKWVRLENGKYLATVNVLMMFKQDKDIKAFKKYELKSKEISDTSDLAFQFIDQQRFQLPAGAYTFEIQLSDKNKISPALPYTQNITVDFPADKPSVSSVELVKSYTKNDNASALSKSGYDLIPNIYNFYDGIDARLIFYCELYGMDKAIAKDQKYLLTYYIESFENNIKFNDFAKAYKETPKPVNVLLADINIRDLATGNYNLVIEARNPNNELMISKKAFFQRNNPNATFSLVQVNTTDVTGTFAEKITNADTLREYINSTFPVSTGYEKEFINHGLAKTDLQTMQKYFLSYWLQRSSSNPEGAWQAYKLQVRIAQANFGTPVKRGYQTDRGRVFLQYGPPNARDTHYAEPNTYPYEIWQYYTLNNSQRNRKFVFYSPDMVTSDFLLLHSDAIGEQYDPTWKVFLRNKMVSPADIGETQVIDVWGDFTQDSWDLPTTNR